MHFTTIDDLLAHLASLNPAPHPHMRVERDTGLWITTCPGCTWTTWHHTAAAAGDAARAHRCGRTFGPSPMRPDAEIAWVASDASAAEVYCDWAVDAWI